jgi:hypothetical protein
MSEVHPNPPADSAPKKVKSTKPKLAISVPTGTQDLPNSDQSDTTTTNANPDPKAGQKPPKSSIKKSSQHPRVKRGPPRPHRRLPMDLIQTRVQKLQNRISRASTQLDDAKRHVEGYLQELNYRKSDPPAPAADDALEASLESALESGPEPLDLESESTRHAPAAPGQPILVP